MEVKLQQIKWFDINSNFGAIGNVHLNGVTVVHNFELALFVIGRYAESDFFKRAFDV
jgi:hypothetical protein